jgi:hypothetical protein
VTSAPTEAARPAPFWTWDLPVVIGAFVLLLAGWIVHGVMTRPRLATFEAEGLSLRYPQGWYPREEAPGHWWYESNEDPAERLEIRIGPRPLLSGSPATAIEFERSTGAGGFYKRLERAEAELGGREWVRTRFSYAFKATDEDAPALATGIEYTVVNGDKLYVVTAHGPESKVADLEAKYLRTVTLKGAP